MGVVRRLAEWAIMLGLAVFAANVGAVLWFSERNAEHYGDGRGLKQPVDAVIVLGSGTDDKGALGNLSRERVAAAVSLLKHSQAHSLILSGGSVHVGVRPVAEAMREHAISLGAAADSLFVETRSLSTFENLRFSLEIAEMHGFKRLALATDAFHLERAYWLASYFGSPEIALVAATGFWKVPRAVQIRLTLREAAAWWLNLGKMIGWKALAVAGVDPNARRGWIQ